MIERGSAIILPHVINIEATFGQNNMVTLPLEFWGNEISVVHPVVGVESLPPFPAVKRPTPSTYKSPRTFSLCAWSMRAVTLQGYLAHKKTLPGEPYSSRVPRDL